MCAISSILLYGRVQMLNPHFWKMTSTLWMKSYLANYLTEICDIFLWNVSRDEHSSSSSVCLQTSAVFYIVQWCGVKGEGWCQNGWGYLAGPDRGWVMGMNLCSDPLPMTQHSNMAQTERPQPTNPVSFPSCPRPWLCLKAWLAVYGERKVTKHIRV